MAAFSVIRNLILSGKNKEHMTVAKEVYTYFICSTWEEAR